MAFDLIFTLQSHDLPYFLGMMRSWKLRFFVGESENGLNGEKFDISRLICLNQIMESLREVPTIKMLLRKSKLHHTVFIVCFITFLSVCLSFRFSFSESPNYPLQLPSSPTSLGPVTRPEVFVIGLSRIGTTSVGDALVRLCYRRLVWESIRLKFLFRSYLRGDILLFVSLTQYYDAFKELPWALVYQDMACPYPNAKLILSLRANEEDWPTSIEGYRVRRKWIGRDSLHGASSGGSCEESYLEAYRNHTASVRGFFAAEEERVGYFVEIFRDGGK